MAAEVQHSMPCAHASAQAAVLTLRLPLRPKSLANAVLTLLPPKKAADLLRHTAEWVSEAVKRDARRDLPGQGFLFSMSDDDGADDAVAA
jgi:hypothetical protein